MGVLASNRKLWPQMAEKYRPEAFAYTTGRAPPPEHEHLFSAALYDRKIRYWAFATAEDRDAFVSTVASASACENPISKRTEK